MKHLVAVIVGLALLAVTGVPGVPAEGGIQTVYQPAGVPFHPDDASWQQAPELTIHLLPQLITVPQGGGSVSSLGVRAMHDGNWVAVRVEWEDPTPNQDVGTASFRDAVAVGFPVTEGETPPSPLMGDPNRPMDIWQWTADFDANAQGRGGFAERYPHTEGVWYFPQDYEVTRRVTAWRGFEPVIELTARGFGTLQRKVAQNVRGNGRYAHGRWAVVLRRQMDTGNPLDPRFHPGATVNAIFAVWNGGEGDVNGRKSVTMSWTPLTFETGARKPSS